MQYKHWSADFFEDERILALLNKVELPSLETLLSLLDLKTVAGLNVFDQCCGNGRISKIFKEAGANVFGCDLSPKGIEFAQNVNQLEYLVLADARHYVQLIPCDISLNYYSSFSYYLEDIENEKIISQLAQSLKSNGIVLLELFNYDFLIKNFKEEIILGESVRKSRIENSILWQDWFQNGIKIQETHVKLYSIDELQLMLSKFFHQIKFIQRNDRLIVTALKLN